MYNERFNWAPLLRCDIGLKSWYFLYYGTLHLMALSCLWYFPAYGTFPLIVFNEPLACLSRSFGGEGIAW